MKPPKKCMKIDQVLNSLFETVSSDSNTDTLSKTGSESERFEEKKIAKICFRKSNSFQSDQVNDSKKSITYNESDQIKQIEDLLEIKPIISSTRNKIAESSDDDYDDDDDDDDVPLAKLVYIKRSATEKENTKRCPFDQPNKTEKNQLAEIIEADDEKETDNEEDDDEDDDVPLFKLISRQKPSISNYKKETKKNFNDETDEEESLSNVHKKKVFAEKTNIITTNNLKFSKKLRRLGNSKSMKAEIIGHSCFLKGLYDFDRADEAKSDDECSDIENIHKNKSKPQIEDISVEIIDKNLNAKNAPEHMGLKSPIIPMNPAEYFVLSLKNLKRKKSSKLLSNISKSVF